MFLPPPPPLKIAKPKDFIRKLKKKVEARKRKSARALARASTNGHDCHALLNGDPSSSSSTVPPDAADLLLQQNAPTTTLLLEDVQMSVQLEKEGGKKKKARKSSNGVQSGSVQHARQVHHDYIDKAMAYNLDLYNMLDKSTTEDLADYCLNNPLVYGDSKVYILGQLHYSKYDALHMARVFEKLNPPVVGLESPLDGKESWQGLADAFCRELGVESSSRDTSNSSNGGGNSTSSNINGQPAALNNPANGAFGAGAFSSQLLNEPVFLNDPIYNLNASSTSNCNNPNPRKPLKLAAADAFLSKLARKSPGSILSICNSFSVAIPRYLAQNFGRGKLIHIDSNRGLALQACSLLNSHSMAHYLRVVSPHLSNDAEKSASLETDAATPEQILQKAAGYSFELLPTHRLAYVLREVSVRTEPDKTTRVIFTERERAMARKLSGHACILAIVGCQHLPGLVAELKDLGYRTVPGGLL